MNRRDFFKLLGKGSIIAGVAATVGLPKIPASKRDKIFSSFAFFVKATRKSSKNFQSLDAAIDSGGYLVPPEIGEALCRDIHCLTHQLAVAEDKEWQSLSDTYIPKVEK